MAKIVVSTSAAWSASLNTGITLYTVPSTHILYVRYLNFSIQNTTGGLQHYFGWSTNVPLAVVDAASNVGILPATLPDDGFPVVGGSAIAIFSSASSGFWLAVLVGDLIG